MLARLLTTAMLVTLVATPLTPRATIAQTELLPDLGMAPLEDFSIERRGAGTVWLRFSTIIVNVGAGPFEVHGYAAASDPADERRDVEQRIFNDYDSWTDHQTNAWMFWARDGHNHWHVDGLQEWELASASAPATVLSTGKKSGFCFWDNYVYGSSEPYHYRPSLTDACETTANGVPMGLSVGWGDEYPSTLNDQYIDISGLPWGEYVLTITADPKGEFIESDTGNNVLTAIIRTRPSGVEVISQTGYVLPIGSGGGTDPEGIQLSASGYKEKGVHHVDLTWSGTSAGGIDIYRNGSRIATDADNDGFYTDVTGMKGSASYSYYVCEENSTTCSDPVTVSF